VLLPERDGETLVGQDAITRRVVAYLIALASRRPTVLLLDDLHWADPASLDLLRVVARGLSEVPLLLLAAYRADEIAPDQPLARLAPLLVREAHAERLDLRPLGEAAIGALVAARYTLADADRARLVRYLVGRTEGNALFLSELLHTLEGEGALRREGERWALGDLGQVPVPTLLRQVIEGRTARLDPETRRLLAVAAAIGQEVSLDVWAAVGEVAGDDMLDHAERAIDARLLTEKPDGAGVRFIHALIREALYQGTSALRRRALHRRVANALLAAAAPDPDAVAYHLRRADDARAAIWLIRAGLRAHRAGALLTAADRYAAASDGDAVSARERAVLLLQSGRIRMFSDTGQALRRVTAAASQAVAAGDHALAAYARFRSG
jgi:predicted ATPase